ncbi:MAG: hypothetical protein JW963_22100 [Anaerolineales bacterium]|nr:hypothetical protein [Anaerolineales bacterium]
MAKEEKKRTYESETLALPPLQMVLVDAKKYQRKRSTKKENKKDDKDFNEETVMRIIDKLIAKE